MYIHAQTLPSLFSVITATLSNPLNVSQAPSPSQISVSFLRHPNSVTLLDPTALPALVEMTVSATSIR